MTLGAHPRDERGFTLVEILVVMLIIGVLAALAIPQFVGQTEKAKDADAMSMARNLQTHVEACYVETRDWSRCDSATEVPKTGLKWASGATAQPGEVQVLVRPFGQDFVAFAATSKTKTLFAVVHATRNRDVSRICFVPSNAYPTGKCRRGGPLSGIGLGTW